MQEDASSHESEGQINLGSPEKHEPHKPSLFRTYIQEFFTLSNTYGAGITAIATVLLAVITFFI
jgi:hypothetical protein